MSSNTRPVLHRKRTSSFSFPSSALVAPRPLKAQRTLPALDTTSAPMGTLTRTTSYLTIPAVLNDSRTAPSDTLPYHRTLRYYKEQRERRKSLLIVARHIEPPMIAVSTQTLPTASSSPTPSESAIRVRLPHAPSAPSAAPAPKPPAPSPSPSPPQTNTPFRPAVRRPTSPLAPVRTPRPPRLAFPRSRPEPDLYRKAITARMRGSPEGQKILLMGARLAVSILTATRELERIVARNNLESEDVTMEPSPPPPPVPPLTNSWVIVPGEDWEMVDCSA